MIRREIAIPFRPLRRQVTSISQPVKSLVKSGEMRVEAMPLPGRITSTAAFWDPDVNLGRRDIRLYRTAIFHRRHIRERNYIVRTGDKKTV
jgi:hypothetical protein